MMANKTRLGWSTGPNPFWVVKFDAGTHTPSRTNLYFDGAEYWLSGYETSPAEGWIANIDANGDFVDDQEFTASGNNVFTLYMVKDGGSLFLAPQLNTQDVGILEIDPADWSIDLQREATYGVGGNPQGVAVDSTGNIYGAKTVSGSGMSIFKVNASGTYQWRYNAYPANSGAGTMRCAAGDDNLYLCSLDGTVDSAEVMKISSATPSITWQRKVTFSSAISAPSIFVDDSDNVYMLINNTGASLNDVYAFKWNSSGTLQWQKKIDSASKEITLSAGAMSLAVDSSGNVYISANNTTDDTIALLKLSSSGAETWEKQIAHDTATSFTSHGVYTDDTYVHLLCMTDSNDLYLCRLSVDDDDDFGDAHELTVSGTGVYTVATSSLTEAAGTITLASSSVTVQATTNSISSATASGWPTYDSKELMA